MTCMSPLPILHPHESDREVIFDGVAGDSPGIDEHRIMGRTEGHADFTNRRDSEFMQ